MIRQPFIDDVWRLIGQNRTVGFYTRDTFSAVPASTAGIYAWFYPLKVRFPSFSEFLEELFLVYDYDSKLRDSQEGWYPVRLGSRNYEIGMRLTSFFRDHAHWDGEWNRVIRHPETSRAFQEALLKASILMPPLYVGKTDDLARRSREHLNRRTDQTGFHERYTRRIAKLNEEIRSGEIPSKTNEIASREVADLLLVTITIDDIADDSETADFEGLIEYILKGASGPIYSQL